MPSITKYGKTKIIMSRGWLFVVSASRYKESEMIFKVAGGIESMMAAFPISRTSRHGS